MESERPEQRDRPSEDDAQGRRILERLVPEIIKRVIEAGIGRLADGPESLRNMVADLKLPKEIVSYLFVQIDETKNGIYRIVSKEIRDFLEQTNFGEEMTKILTKLSFEVKTEIRFIPNDSGAPGSTPKPDVRTSVQVRSERPSERMPRAERAERVSDRPTRAAERTGDQQEADEGSDIT